MHLFTLSQYTSAGETDDARIARCLRDSAAESPRTIVFDVPCCTVSRAILLPPDTTVILDGCRIVQADATVDNVFRSDNGIPDPADPLRMPLACGKTRTIWRAACRCSLPICRTVCSTRTRRCMAAKCICRTRWIGSISGWRGWMRGNI